MELRCAACVLAGTHRKASEREAKPAVTVLAGWALCVDDLDLVLGKTFDDDRQRMLRVLLGPAALAWF